MYLLVTAILGAVGWFLFRRWRRNLPVDPRLTAAYWQKSAIVLGAYLLSILAGAGVTRIMVGFNRSGWADLLMVAFFAVWVLYGAVWLLRFLPTSKLHPAWLIRSRGWIDALAMLSLAGLAAGARML
ncbi:hypothetical protein [Devosia sp. Root635]|uniref:hypothetical protein n=1 Tax=Devosia sp. Root635 TaxID=1736575 RepID=UPI0006F4E8E8|nr:hypothetical protein [Devosia sp. Root635]KRA47827.1 hypothetical protein ASD80_03270 [Devosia sp. Root635]